MLPLGDMDHYDAWLVAVSYSGIITSYCLSNFEQCFSLSGRNYSPPTLKDLTASSRAGCGATSRQSLATENSQLFFSLFVPTKSHQLLYQENVHWSSGCGGDTYIFTC